MVFDFVAMSQPPSSVEKAIDHREATLFADRKNGDLYWEALIQIGKNNRAEAEKLAAAIRSNQNVYTTSPWKEEHPADVFSFFDRLFIQAVHRSPQLLSFMSLFESIGLREHNGYLDDLSVSTEFQNFQEVLESFRSIQKYDLEQIPSDQKYSFQTFQWMLENQVAGEPFLFHAYPVTQIFGAVQSLTMTFLALHKLELAEDVNSYLSRLNQIPRQFQQVVEKLKFQQEKGILPPRFAVEKSIRIIAKFIEPSAKMNIFYRNLAEKIQKIEMGNKEGVLSKVESAIQSKVYPAYRKLKEYLEGMLTAATENRGVWALPNGDQFYNYCLACHTTTDLSANEIHELGLKEVDRIQKEMRIHLAKEGLDDPKREVGELLQELSNNKSYYFSNTPEGKAECLQRFAAILERSRKELWPLFNLKPAAMVEIEAVPAHEEVGAPAAYYLESSIDGSRPGVFYVNLHDMDTLPKYRMETLAVHEAEPGHHFQCSIQNEMPLPARRKVGYYTAYTEGWALYTEKLAYEQGFYSSSVDRLGHLQDELLRAARLVIDTGIHSKRWSREKAIQYMAKTTGEAQEDVVSEIERYFVLPGQACAYKIGQLKLLELRQRAKDQLGEKFDIKEFHDLVLKTGSVPLKVLETAINEYIRNSK